MGYFGSSGFENDDALDWLDQHRGGVTATSLKRAFAAYRRYRPKKEKRFTKSQIDENIRLALISDLEDPPRWWRNSGKTLIQLLQHTETEVRSDLESGRYLDRKYGPAEQALAAAELLACWGGKPPATLHPSAKKLIRKLPATPVPRKLLDEAIATVRDVVRNTRYRKMRRFYLGAFQDSRRRGDSMDGVRDILVRLRPFVRQSGKESVSYGSVSDGSCFERE